jgi:hypothetical protein
MRGSVMKTKFSEFSRVFERFSAEFPKHALTEHLRRSIVRARFPEDQWLEAQTRRMEEIMRPLWRKTVNH